MDNTTKTTKWLIAIWTILAIISFVGSFFVTPLFFKVIGLTFGGLNMLIILSWIIAVLQARKDYHKLKEE